MRLPGETTRQFKKRKAGSLAANLVPPTAQQATQLVSLLDTAAADPARADQSAASYWADMSAQAMLPPLVLKRLAAPASRQARATWLKRTTEERMGTLAGHPKAWKRFLSQDTGCRMARGGEKKRTRPDYFADLHARLVTWLRNEVLAGKCFGADDLLFEWEGWLDDEVYEMTKLQEAEGLTEEQALRLRRCLDKQKALESTKLRRDWRAKLCWVTRMTPRVPGNVASMSAEETNLVCLLTLQSWDHLTHLLATGDADALGSLVADPTELMLHRNEIAVVCQDAVPVYLDPSTGKVLVSFADIELRRQRQHLLADPSKAEVAAQLQAQHKPFGEAEGSSRKNKNRLTFICRQRLRGLFFLPEGELPTGDVLSSILLVPCSQACRLADMSVTEPSVWLRDHAVCVNGERRQRRRGEKVGALLSSWRAARRAQSHMFEAGVLVYGQPESTEDESVCCLIAEEIRHEAPHGCLLSVDLFGGEHTACTSTVHWLYQQVVHTIGPHVTNKLQLTDVRFAKLAKNAQRRLLPTLRRAIRDRSHAEGASPTLTANCLTAMRMAVTMHRAMVEDSLQHNGVVLAAREAGYLAYVPTRQGLRPAEGSEWEALPLGSSRLAGSVLTRRSQALHEAGLGSPPLPDWSSLSALRDRLVRDAREAAVAKGEALADDPARGDVGGFLDLTPCAMGETLFPAEAEASAEPVDDITLSCLTLQDFEDGKHQLLSLLAPSRRRQLKQTLEQRLAPSALPTKAGRAQKRRTEAKLQSRGQKKAVYAELRKRVADVGLAATAAQLVPRSGKRGGLCAGSGARLLADLDATAAAGEAAAAADEAAPNAESGQAGAAAGAGRRHKSRGRGALARHLATHKGGAGKLGRRARQKKGGAGKLARRAVQKNLQRTEEEGGGPPEDADFLKGF